MHSITVVEFPRLMVLGDFNLPSLGMDLELAQEFLAAMTAMAESCPVIWE